jgi:hypothetical protein
MGLATALGAVWGPAPTLVAGGALYLGAGALAWLLLPPGRAAAPAGAPGGAGEAAA